MNIRGNVFLLYGGLTAVILIAAIYIAYLLFDLFIESDGSPHHAFWFSAGIITIAFLLTGIAAVSRAKRVYRSKFIKLKRITEEAASKPLSNAFPGLKMKERDEAEVLIRDLYSFMNKRHENLRQILHFSSLASHELRTPLTIIRNQLEDGLQLDVTFEHLKTIVASAYDEIIRMHHLVNDLMTISTMQAGTIRLEKSRIIFPDFIKEFYDEALLLSREKDISVVLSKGEPVNINGDPVRIRQMLFNVFDNALKFTPAKGRIYLSYEVNANTVKLLISDTGAGMPADKLNRIFEPFYRIEPREERRHGAGLGLALVRWIAEAHRGTVTAESEEGKGSTFTITLPR